jgi:hypothetical protein
VDATDIRNHNDLINATAKNICHSSLNAIGHVILKLTEKLKEIGLKEISGLQTYWETPPPSGMV